MDKMKVSQKIAELRARNGLNTIRGTERTKHWRVGGS